MAEQKVDTVVQALIDVVAERKQEISKAEKPNWKTNCTFAFSEDAQPGQRYNIQTITDVSRLVGMLAFLMGQEENFKKAAKALNVSTKNFTWLGYSVEDWKEDLDTRITKINISKKKKELEEIEARLDKLISPELRAQLELEAIKALLEV